MTTLREFIATRQAELASQLAALKHEERELRIALEALDGGKPRANGKVRGERPTLNAMIVTVLRQHGQATAETVIERIKGQYFVDVPKSSMSPQLSRLKREGIVELDLLDKTWRLASEGQPSNRNEATTGASETSAEGAGGTLGTPLPTQSEPDA